MIFVDYKKKVSFYYISLINKYKLSKSLNNSINIYIENLNK